MPTKKIFLAGYDDGHGFKIVDPATGALLRQVQGSWWTDNMQDMYNEGSNLWCVDTDSSLVRADLDGVVKAKVDLGYYGTGDSGEDEFWSIYVMGAHIYHIHKINTNNPNPGGGLNQGDPQPADSELYYLVKRDKMTLAVVSETKLEHENLANQVGNQTWISGRVRCWMSDGFWMLCENGGPKNGFCLKIGYDGVPTGAEIDLASFGFYGNQQFWDGATKLVYTDMNYTGDYSTNHSISLSGGKVIEFSGAGSITDITAWGPITVLDQYDFSIGSERVPRIAGSTISFPVSASSYAWVGGPHDGLSGAHRQLTINYLDGTGLVESDPVWLNRWDQPVDLNPLTNLPECLAPYDADRFFMIDERYGIWLVNFTTGAVDYTTGYNFMQGYSSDATEIESGRMITTNYYNLTGTVLENGTPAASRKVMVYDQETGTYIGKVLTNGSGVYSMTVFSTAPKFAVCVSADGTKNFKVNAHIVPA